MVKKVRFVKLGVVRVYMGRVRAVREEAPTFGDDEGEEKNIESRSCRGQVSNLNVECLSAGLREEISNPVFTRTGIQRGISNVEGKDYRFLFPCSKSRE